ILPALSLNGILHADIQAGVYNAEMFKNFIGALLTHMHPFLEPNSVIVLDNASIHKADELQEMVEAW
ncbi:hypothetical protein BS47DRAFT_1256822, partial [Hydnum rufescens UP504]